MVCLVRDEVVKIIWKHFENRENNGTFFLPEQRSQIQIIRSKRVILKSKVGRTSF
jgi:hypothetical protein